MKKPPHFYSAAALESLNFENICTSQTYRLAVGFPR